MHRKDAGMHRISMRAGKGVKNNATKRANNIIWKGAPFNLYVMQCNANGWTPSAGRAQQERPGRAEEHHTGMCV